MTDAEREHQIDARIVDAHQRMYGAQAEDVWAEMPDEPEDVCRGCGAPHVWHGRDEADRYCWECRFPEDR